MRRQPRDSVRVKAEHAFAAHHVRHLRLPPCAAIVPPPLAVGLLPHSSVSQPCCSRRHPTYGRFLSAPRPAKTSRLWGRTRITLTWAKNGGQSTAPGEWWQQQPGSRFITLSAQLTQILSAPFANSERSPRRARSGWRQNLSIEASPTHTARKERIYSRR